MQGNKKNMSGIDPQLDAKVKNLRETLHRHNYRYYVLDDPEISDLQFAR